MRTYVNPRANDAPSRRFPHCLWIMLEIILACVWELIMMPRSRMTNAGMGLRENSYVLGGRDSSASSSAYGFSDPASMTVVLSRSRIRVDSTSIPHYQIVSLRSKSNLSREDASTHQSTSNEEYSNGHVFHVRWSPLTTPATEVFQENIRRAIEENERALDKFGRWAPFLV